MKLTNKKQTLRNGLTLIFILTLIFSIAQMAQADQLRVTTTPGELQLCVAGFPLTAGPDTGKAATAGDECVLNAGNHVLTAPATITVPSLTVRSVSSATTVTAGAFPAIIITVSNVTLGGDDDEGFQISGGPVGIGITGTATDDIRISHLFISTAGFGIIAAGLPNLETVEIMDNEIRNNPSGGFVVFPTVGFVDDLRIYNNEFDANGGGGFPANIAIANAGNLSDVLISSNNIRFSPGHGIAFGPTVTNISDMAIERNAIQGNGFGLPAPGGMGILFANTGQVEVIISDNKQGNGGGISGNACSGVLFDGINALGFGPVVAGNVTDVEAVITDNNISDNGIGPSPCPGLTFLNSGDVEDLELYDNVFEHNGSDGVLALNGNEFSDAEIKRNRFENNGIGVMSPLAFIGNGMFIVPGEDVESLVFEDNVAQGNYYHGIFVVSLSGDVKELSFQGDTFEQNGTGIAPGGGFNGAGLEVASFAAIHNVTLNEVTANRNGGSGVYFDSTATSVALLGILPAANLSDMRNITISNSEFSFNGNSAPSGAGDGVFLRGDNILDVLSDNNVLTRNDDHGLFVYAMDDTDNFQITGGMYNFNDFNNDEVGSGIQVEATNDLFNISVDGVESNDNENGIFLYAKGQNGTQLTVSNSTGCDNNGSGIRIKSNDDVNNVLIEGNAASGNDENLDFEVTDQGSIQQINNNVGGGCELPGTNPAPTSFVASSSAPVTLSVMPLGNGAFEFRALNAHNLNVMHLDIISTSGERMYNTSSTTGTVLAHGLSNSGQPLANGVYFFAVTLEKTDGSVERIVKKVMILR